MTPRFHAIAAAAIAILGLPAAMAQTGPEFKFSGYGTVGGAYSNNDHGDFLSTRFAPNGAGATRSWSMTPLTRLGVQADAKFGDKISAVVQLLSQHAYDNSFTPAVEWANVKFQVTPELAVRAGRVALPSYLISESRFVGYTNPWTYAPTEVYSALALTNSDGVDATWRRRIGGGNNTLAAFYGKSKAKVPGDAVAKTNPSWGISDTFEIGSWTLRAGYQNMKLQLDAGSLAQLLGGIDQVAAGAAGVPVPTFQALAGKLRDLSAKYSTKDMAVSGISAGLVYDPGSWFVQAEGVLFKSEGLLSDASAAYVTAGWRFGNLTPYATVARVVSHVDLEPAIDTSGTPPLATPVAQLVGGINSSLRQFNGTQTSVGAGVRWDFRPGMAAKAQFERVSIPAGSPGRFRPATTSALPGGSSSLVTVALEFVF